MIFLSYGSFVAIMFFLRAQTDMQFKKSIGDAVKQNIIAPLKGSMPMKIAMRAGSKKVHISIYEEEVGMRYSGPSEVALGG